MNLVAGATGLLGSEICRLLRERGEPVTALVRRSSPPEKTERLRALGAEIRIGDLRDAASLREACAGMDAVLSTANSLLSLAPGNGIEEVDRNGTLALADAAEAAGVRKFVYVSFSGNQRVDSPFLAAKRAVEARLREARIDATILRPSCFMEVHLTPTMGFDAANGRARVFGTGDAPISWISVRDVAQFAAASLHDDAASDATIDLGGPQALSIRKVVAIFEALTGHPFQIDAVPLPAIEQQYLLAPDPISKTFAALALGVAQGDAIDMTETLRRLPIALRSVRDFAQQQLPAFA